MLTSEYIPTQENAKADFDDLYAMQYYLAIYDRQPVIFEFQYSCPRDEWRIQNFNVSFDFPQDISQLTKANLSSIFS